MAVSGDHIGTLGMVVTIIDEGVRVDHVIIICLLQENKGVGVLALEHESHTELILFHQNVTGKVLHAEQLVLIQGRLAIVEEIGHLQESMMNTS